MLTLSSVSSISSSKLSLIVVLFFSKSIDWIKVGDRYFQKTRFLPLTSGFRTINKIPGSAVTSLAIKAGNAKLVKLYEIILSTSL